MLIVLNLFVSLAVTVGAYLFFPMIILLRGKKFSLKTLKIIATLNAAIVYVLFSIMNYYLDEGVANFGACMLWGVLSYKLMKKHCSNATSDLNNLQAEIDIDDTLTRSSTNKVASVSEPASRLKASNAQRIFNVVISLLMILSVGINVFLFMEIRHCDSQQEKLMSNVNYLLSSNEDLRKADELIKEELKETTWRSKINAFTSKELSDKLGGRTTYEILYNSHLKDWGLLEDIASSRN